jgi:hypothetical protein
VFFCSVVGIVCQDPIRAVVMGKRIILMVPDGADSLISILEQYIREWVRTLVAVALCCIVRHCRGLQAMLIVVVYLSVKCVSYQVH